MARHTDIVLTSLPSSAALDAVIGGPDGLIASGRKNLIVAGLSTLAIEDKGARARRAGCLLESTLLDCPLSGTGAQAADR